MSIVGRINNRLFVATPGEASELYRGGLLSKKIKLHKTDSQMTAQYFGLAQGNAWDAEAYLPAADRIALSHAKHRGSSPRQQSLRSQQVAFNDTVVELRALESDMAEAEKKRSVAHTLFKKNPIEYGYLQERINNQMQRYDTLAAERKAKIARLAGAASGYKSSLDARTKAGLLARVVLLRKWSRTETA